MIHLQQDDIALQVFGVLYLRKHAVSTIVT